MGKKQGKEISKGLIGLGVATAGAVVGLGVFGAKKGKEFATNKGWIGSKESSRIFEQDIEDLILENDSVEGFDVLVESDGFINVNLSLKEDVTSLKDIKEVLSDVAQGIKGINLNNAINEEGLIFEGDAEISILANTEEDFLVLISDIDLTDIEYVTH